MIKGGDVLERYYDTFMAHLKQFLEWSIKTVSSYFTGLLVITDFLSAGQLTHNSGNEHMFIVLRTCGYTGNRVRSCVRICPQQFVENGRLHEEAGGSTISNHGHHNPQPYFRTATDDPTYVVVRLTGQDRSDQSLCFGAHQDIHRSSRFEGQTCHRDLRWFRHIGKLC